MSFKSLHLNSYFILFFFCMYGFTMGQETKIENYRKWKSINTILNNVQSKGAILLRVKNYDNSKRYIESNYDQKTYDLYCDKIEHYKKTLKEDFTQGFTFSKVILFDSKYSKHFTDGKFESIVFKSPDTDEILHFEKEESYLIIDIIDFKHNHHANPLNLTAQKAFRVLNNELNPDELLNIKQPFGYHIEENEQEGCPHIFEGAKALDKLLSKRLTNSSAQMERLGKKIKKTQKEKVSKYKTVLEALNKQKEETTAVKVKEKLDEKIKKYEDLIEQSKLLINELFSN